MTEAKLSNRQPTPPPMMETIVVAAGRTLMTGQPGAVQRHGPGSEVAVSAAEAAQLRASGHAIDPDAPLVQVQEALTSGGPIHVNASAAAPLVNPGLVGHR